MKTGLKQVQGVAMLMALVMLAIASSLAVAIWYNSQLSFARVHNLQQAYQAKHYGQGMLLWASDILREDYAQDANQHDSNTDPWLQGIQGMVVENAVLSGSLVGLNDRFNVNNLIINGLQSEQHVQYFKRLLLALNLDVNIAEKVIDWMDSDQIPQTNGAEDFVYLAKSPAYQTSGQQLKHVDELALLDGLSAEDFQLLSRYVTALPISNQATKMNVNTMAPVMLAALDPQISNDMALRLHQNGVASYPTLDSFFEEPSARFIFMNIRANFENLIGVKTTHLQASSLVQMEGSELVQFALLERNNDGSAKVLNRSLSPYLPKPLIN